MKDKMKREYTITMNIDSIPFASMKSNNFKTLLLSLIWDMEKCWISKTLNLSDFPYPRIREMIVENLVRIQRILKVSLFFLCATHLLSGQANSKTYGYYSSEPVTSTDTHDRISQADSTSILNTKKKKHDLPSSALGRPNQSTQPGRPQLIGTNKYEWANGDRYEGLLTDGLPNGNGIYIWANGDRYEGEFRHGKRSGKGFFVWGEEDVLTAGSSYNGEFVDGEMTGYGLYTMDIGMRTRGAVFEGQFTRGQISNGTLTYKNGDKYVGFFSNFQPSGEGVMSYTDGRILRGQFDNESGKGHIFWPDGRQFQGTWKLGLPHGEGRMTISQSETVSGEWRNGCYLGNNFLANVNPNTFVCDRFHRTGKVKYYTGLIGPDEYGRFVAISREDVLSHEYEGEMVNGFPHGFGRYSSVFFEYSGSFVNGMKHGRGTERRKMINEYTYKGEFKDGERHGHGSASYDSGVTYEGQWRNGIPHGNGRYTNSAGIVFEGIWNKGCIEKNGIIVSIYTSIEDCNIQR